MSNEYYGIVRREIEPLLPKQTKRIVDVGCGMGGTINWLRSRYPQARTVGLEGNAELKPQLEKSVDEAHFLDLNGVLPDLQAPDLILCLDVLEHLVRPDQVLAQLVAMLAPGGTAIISLPNVAHLSVSLPLFMRGEFEYRDAGILDRTHLRFFTRNSALAMIRSSGLTVESALESGLLGPKTRLMDKLTFGRFRDQLSRQYVFAGRKLPAGDNIPPIRWDAAR